MVRERRPWPSTTRHPHRFVVFTISHSLLTMAAEQLLSSTCSPVTSLLSYEITLFNCKVVHVETGTVLPQPQCVVIDHHGRIAHIVPDNDKNEKGKDKNDDDTMSRHRWIATSRTSFDCQGGYLIPGFIDCHVHVTGKWEKLNGIWPSCWGCGFASTFW
jgi:hypothetical protein